MLEETEEFRLSLHALRNRSNDPLGKLYVDRDEVGRVLCLWRQSSHPEAAKRIREFEHLLDSIEKEIDELRSGNKLP